jgi:hypothetical protein
MIGQGFWMQMSAIRHVYKEERGGQFAGGKMARITEWEKNQKFTEVQRILSKHPFGLRESELTSELGWERRTVNNYLRALEDEGLIYKEGWEWYADYGDY